jgi:hypothetical protein
MNRFEATFPATLFCVLSFAAAATLAQDPASRSELRRADLTGAPGMEAVLSTQEWKPGDEIAAHFHHGIEAGYFIEGGMVQSPRSPPRMIQGPATLRREEVTLS